MSDGGVVEVGESAFQDNWAQQYGGAIATSSGRASISNSTLSGNQALKGGGVYAFGGETTLTHLTLIDNRAIRIVGAGIYREAGAVFLRNSIVAGSESGDDCSGSISEKRGNFSQDGTCSTRAGGDPFLADMVESPAHYPLSDASAAHGAADPAFCLATDQLDNPRPHCDIGAIESARDPNYQPNPQAGLPADCTLADQIIAANTDAPAGSCPAGNGADTIELTRDITLGASLPTIASDLSINGNGHTISGGKRFSIFDIESGSVALKHVTLIHGSNPDGYGGAITLRNEARLTISGVTFRYNKARSGGAIASVYNSFLLVYDSGFYDNAATSLGGAIWSDGRYGCVDDSSFRRNTGIITNSRASNSQAHIHGGFSQCGTVTNSFSDT